MFAVFVFKLMINAYVIAYIIRIFPITIIIIMKFNRWRKWKIISHLIILRMCKCKYPISRFFFNRTKRNNKRVWFYPKFKTASMHDRPYSLTKRRIDVHTCSRPDKRHKLSCKHYTNRMFSRANRFNSKGELTIHSTWSCVCVCAGLRLQPAPGAYDHVCVCVQGLRLQPLGPMMWKWVEGPLGLCHLTSHPDSRRTLPMVRHLLHCR